MLALLYPFAGVAPLLSARFQALGRARPAYLISIGTVVAVKVPLLLALGGFGTVGVWISFPVAEFLTAGLALFLLRPRRHGRQGKSGRPAGRPLP